MSERWLHTWGWRPWTEVVSLFDGLEAAWADLDGWHLGEDAPSTLLGATHVWAWGDGILLRARVDRSRCLVIALTETDDRAWPVPPSESRPVTGVAEMPVLRYDGGEREIPPHAAVHYRGGWTVASVPAPTGISLFRWSPD